MTDAVIAESAGMSSPGPTPYSPMAKGVAVGVVALAAAFFCWSRNSPDLDEKGLAVPDAPDRIVKNARDNFAASTLKLVSESEFRIHIGKVLRHWGWEADAQEVTAVGEYFRRYHGIKALMVDGATYYYCTPGYESRTTANKVAPWAIKQLAEKILLKVNEFSDGSILLGDIRRIAGAVFAEETLLPELAAGYKLDPYERKNVFLEIVSETKRLLEPRVIEIELIEDRSYDPWSAFEHYLPGSYTTAELEIAYELAKTSTNELGLTSAQQNALKSVTDKMTDVRNELFIYCNSYLVDEGKLLEKVGILLKAHDLIPHAENVPSRIADLFTKDTGFQRVKGADGEWICQAELVELPAHIQQQEALKEQLEIEYSTFIVGLIGSGPYLDDDIAFARRQFTTKFAADDSYRSRQAVGYFDKTWLHQTPSGQARDFFLIRDASSSGPAIATCRYRVTTLATALRSQGNTQDTKLNPGIVAAFQRAADLAKATVAETLKLLGKPPQIIDTLDETIFTAMKTTGLALSEDSTNSEAMAVRAFIRELIHENSDFVVMEGMEHTYFVARSTTAETIASTPDIANYSENATKCSDQIAELSKTGVIVLEDLKAIVAGLTTNETARAKLLRYAHQVAGSNLDFSATDGASIGEWSESTLRAISYRGRPQDSDRELADWDRYKRLRQKFAEVIDAARRSDSIGVYTAGRKIDPPLFPNSIVDSTKEISEVIRIFRRDY